MDNGSDPPAPTLHLEFSDEKPNSSQLDFIQTTFLLTSVYCVYIYYGITYVIASQTLNSLACLYLNATYGFVYNKE